MYACCKHGDGIHYGRPKSGQIAYNQILHVHRYKHIHIRASET